MMIDIMFIPAFEGSIFSTNVIEYLSTVDLCVHQGRVHINIHSFSNSLLFDDSFATVHALALKDKRGPISSSDPAVIGETSGFQVFF